MLVQDLNKQVAISDEVRNTGSDKTKSGGLLFDRKVTRIVTAGTLIDENFMDPYENNFLLAVHSETLLADVSSSNLRPLAKTDKVGLSWVDLSSGVFYTQPTNLVSLSSQVARIRPREILLDSSLEHLDPTQFAKTIGEGSYTVTHHHLPIAAELSASSWSTMLEKPLSEKQYAMFTHEEVMAGSLLLDYVKNKLRDTHVVLQTPVRQTEEEIMSIDKQSLRGLEVRSTLRDGLHQGSLLHAVRDTVTKGGSRLLSQRLVSPSMSLSIINNRLDLVTELLSNEQLREGLVMLLRQTFDTARLLQKFYVGRGDADDLLGLSKTINIMDSVSGILRDHVLSHEDRTLKDDARKDPSRGLTFLWDILGRMDLQDPVRLADRVTEAIDQEGLNQQHLIEEIEAAEVIGLAEQVIEDETPNEKLRGIGKRSSKSREVSAASRDDDSQSSEPWIMRRNASLTLEMAHADLDSLFREKAELVSRLCDQLGAKSLTLRWTPQLGHHCHLKSKSSRTVESLQGARTVGSTRSTRSFYLSDWTHLGNKINDAKMRIRTEEQRVFTSLRTQVIENLVRLRRNAAVLDELDVACSSANIASRHNHVRPILHTGKTHKIVGGRHPTVDVGLKESGRHFIANDCFVGGEEQILLITGPNMAGKSTFLRQNALISILAQTGCFVPADYAEIGLVDKVFSRVGSADNLYQDQSTFMVEMLETAEILKQATPRSFVIMDEVGRGTTPEDGIAVGYACLHHLHNVNKCRTLFATHFHALADMTRGFDNLACYCTDVAEESDGSWTYVHRLRKGVNRESHALKVARLAGMPAAAIAIASEVLQFVGPQTTQPSSIVVEARRTPAAGEAGG
ncbi:MutS protein 1 [Elasticomyces elasticus]|nr:MutS protein 1 [Elasticomyces elasticus]